MVRGASIVARGSFAAVLAELHGAISPTVGLDERTRMSLVEPLASTADDLLTELDGRPRDHSVRWYPASRDGDRPRRDRAGPPRNDTVRAMGDRTNDHFDEVLAREGCAPAPRTLVATERRGGGLTIHAAVADETDV